MRTLFLQPTCLSCALRRQALFPSHPCLPNTLPCAVSPAGSPVGAIVAATVSTHLGPFRGSRGHLQRLRLLRLCAFAPPSALARRRPRSTRRRTQRKRRPPALSTGQCRRSPRNRPRRCRRPARKSLPRSRPHRCSPHCLRRPPFAGETALRSTISSTFPRPISCPRRPIRRFRPKVVPKGAASRWCTA